MANFTITNTVLKGTTVPLCVLVYNPQGANSQPTNLQTIPITIDASGDTLLPSILPATSGNGLWERGTVAATIPTDTDGINPISMIGGLLGMARVGEPNSKWKNDLVGMQINYGPNGMYGYGTMAQCLNGLASNPKTLPNLISLWQTAVKNHTSASSTTDGTGTVIVILELASIGFLLGGGIFAAAILAGGIIIYNEPAEGDTGADDVSFNGPGYTYANDDWSSGAAFYYDVEGNGDFLDIGDLQDNSGKG